MDELRDGAPAQVDPRALSLDVNAYTKLLEDRLLELTLENLRLQAAVAQLIPSVLHEANEAPPGEAEPSDVDGDSG